MSLHIDGMLVDGEAIPDPSILDALANDPAIKGAVALLVTVDLAQKAGRFNITALKEFRSRDREGAVPNLKQQATIRTLGNDLVPIFRSG